MKAQKLRSLLGGGCTLLVLIFIVSIFLVVPKGNLHATETTVIDGIEYEIIELTGDNDANIAKIAQCNQKTNGNYYYVMTADWDLRVNDNNIYLNGNAVIFDLFGFTINARPWVDHIFCALVLHSITAEITDTSVSGTGTVECWDDNRSDGCGIAAMGRCQNFIISGGNFSCLIDVYNDCPVTILGGNVKAKDKENLINMSPGVVTVAPYLITDMDGNICSYDAYAVSTSNLVAGIYNTAYGYQWNLNAHTLSNLTLTTDKTYYLWARNADDKYQFLNLRCTDGKTWQTIS